MQFGDLIVVWYQIKDTLYGCILQTAAVSQNSVDVIIVGQRGAVCGMKTSPDRSSSDLYPLQREGVIAITFCDDQPLYKTRFHGNHVILRRNPPNCQASDFVPFLYLSTIQMVSSCCHQRGSNAKHPWFEDDLCTTTNLNMQLSCVNPPG